MGAPWGQNTLPPIRCAWNHVWTVCGWQNPSAFFSVRYSLPGDFLGQFCLVCGSGVLVLNDRGCLHAQPLYVPALIPAPGPQACSRSHAVTPLRHRGCHAAGVFLRTKTQTPHYRPILLFLWGRNPATAKGNRSAVQPIPGGQNL